jgi:SAM-dependent methyltransferase
MDVRAQFQGCDSFAERRCVDCELRFFPPELAGSAQLYEALQVHDWYYLRDKWEHGEALEDVHSGAKLLEIGAGEGEFVARALTHGVDALGLELNSVAAARARSKGRNVEESRLEQLLPEWEGRFDVVCSFQVLEHLSRPREFLEQAYRLLKPGGRLLTCVPDGEGWIRFEDNPLDLPPHHVTRWSERCFERLGVVAPLRLKRIAREPLPRHHVRGFVAAHAEELGRRTRGVLRFGPRLQALARAAVALSPIRSRFRGQGLYACHERAG